jgi:uncharacterized damage-inducible protein DinB
MRVAKRSAVLLCFLLCAGAAFAQDSKPAPTTVGASIDSIVGIAEREVVSAADAMPEDKYGFAPTNGEFKGVRTFAQEVKHIAAVNYVFGSTILQEKPPMDLGGENGPDAIKSKADIMKFLKDSFAYAHKAVTSINDQNAVVAIKPPFGKNDTTRTAIAAFVPTHCMDHYGQMVEYLRMNGIIPPASR